MERQYALPHNNRVRLGKLGKYKVNNLLRYTKVLKEEEKVLKEETTWALNEEGKRYGLNMNFEKTKTTVFGEKEPARKL